MDVHIYTHMVIMLITFAIINENYDAIKIEGIKQWYAYISMDFFIDLIDEKSSQYITINNQENTNHD